ncbi:response regulator transcription factor [Streptomyces tagetis]|uniref:Response regulator transcription factor n=1 Tax=Streptomyces tagetis TaxID=2820809 RepID=A0A940XPJ7_9ACTN|nr:response regulator transcription factor [Streptomyces sp. RG38]MBQ0828434.1 response regulator transcription factor [Streptomyces sp. RG38]
MRDDTTHDTRTPPHPFPFPEAAGPAALRVVVADDNPVVRAGLTALLSGRTDITVVAEAADGREACEATHRHRPDVVLLDVRMPVVDGISALPYLVGIAPVMMLTYSGESAIVREALRRGAGGYLVHGEFTADALVTAVRDIRHGRAHFTPTAAEALLTHVRQSPPPDTPLPDTLGRDSASAHASISPTALSPQRDRGNSLKSLSHLQLFMRQSTSTAPDRSGYRLSTREVEIMDLIASGMTNQQIAAACFISEKTVKNHINRIFAKLHSTSRSEATAKWLGTAPDGDPR